MAEPPERPDDEEFLRELDVMEQEIGTAEVGAAPPERPIARFPHFHEDVEAYYRTRRWQELREEALRRDPSCCVCGKPPEIVHHRKWPGVLGEEPVTDLTPLCRECALWYYVQTGYCPDCISVVLGQNDKAEQPPEGEVSVEMGADGEKPTPASPTGRLEELARGTFRQWILEEFVGWRDDDPVPWGHDDYALFRDAAMRLGDVVASRITEDVEAELDATQGDLWHVFKYANPEMPWSRPADREAVARATRALGWASYSRACSEALRSFLEKPDWRQGF